MKALIRSGARLSSARDNQHAPPRQITVMRNDDGFVVVAHRQIALRIDIFERSRGIYRDDIVALE
jgi:hypothetical protein